MSEKKGRLIVISASSGAGKTTICRTLINMHPELAFSISCTSRAPRDSEVNGKDYYFISRKEFENRIKSGDFAEWELIYNDYYGTLKETIDKALENGKTLLLDVDVKGGISIKNAYSDDTTSIFLKAPSREELIRRLKNRGTENELSIRKRIERFDEEQKLAQKFDHIIVNDDLKKTVELIYAIIKGEKDGNRNHPF